MQPLTSFSSSLSFHSSQSFNLIPSTFIICLFQLLGETSKESSFFGKTCKVIYDIHQTFYLKAWGDYWFNFDRKTPLSFPLEKIRKHGTSYYDKQNLKKINAFFPNRKPERFLISLKDCQIKKEYFYDLLEPLTKEIYWDVQELAFLAKNQEIKEMAKNALSCLSFIQTRPFFTESELKEQKWETLVLAKKNVEQLNLDYLDEIVDQNFDTLKQLPPTAPYRTLLSILPLEGEKCLSYFFEQTKYLEPKQLINFILLEGIWKRFLENLKKNPQDLEGCPDDVKGKSQWMKKALLIHPKTVLYFRNFYEQNEEFFSWVLKTNGLCLQYLKEAQNNENLVSIAVDENQNSLQFAAKLEIKKYRNLRFDLYILAKNQRLLSHIQANDKVFSKLKSNKKNNFDFVIQAIQANRCLLINSQISPLLLDQKEFVLKLPLDQKGEFVFCMGYFFEFASSRLKQETETIEQAIKIHPLSYCFIDSKKKDSKMTLLAFEGLKKFSIHTQAVVQQIPPFLLKEESFIKKAIQVNSDIIPYLIDLIDLNKEVIDALIESDGMSIKYLIKKLGEEGVSCEQCRKAVKNNPFAYFEIPSLFKENSKILELIDH